MEFSRILGQKSDSGDKATPRDVDAFAMVNGKPSNALICEEMLEGEKASPEVTAHMVKLAKELGFSDAEAQQYWG